MEIKENEIYCVDCYKAIKHLPDNCIDLIVTDPPYLIENTKAGGNSELAKSIQGMNNELANGVLTQSINESILSEFLRVMKVPNIYIYGVIINKFQCILIFLLIKIIVLLIL